MAPRFVTRKKVAKNDISLDEVAMNPSKVREIIDVFNKDTTRLLILSGPTGSSKSTVLRALCRDSGRPVREYVDKESGSPDSFGDFLVGCSLASPNTIVFADELPNLSHNSTLERFIEALEYWVGLSKAPMLLIPFTEIEFGQTYGELLIVSRIFARVLDQPGVEHIKCQPISTRFLSKALKSYTSDRDLITRLSSLGDIRQAISGLTVPISAKTDTKFSIFHRIGKVVWASKNIDPVDLLDRDEYDDQFDSHVFENYAVCNGASLDLSDFSKCSDYLSLEDAFHPGLSSFALHTLLKTAPKQGGRFHTCVMSKQGELRYNKLDLIEKMNLELLFVRQESMTSVKDLLLNRSLGLVNAPPRADIYLSDSDSDF